MIILAVLASLIAIGALCYLLFTLAIYAVPFFAGMATANWAYGTGAGLLGAIVVGLVGGVATFLAIQLLLVIVRPLWLRVLIALAFVVPSVIAGYHATHGIVKHTMPSETWQLVFSVIGAIAVGVTAFVRLTATGLAAPEPARRGVS